MAAQPISGDTIAFGKACAIAGGVAAWVYAAVAVKVPADRVQLCDSCYLDEAIVIPVVVNCCLGARGGVHPRPHQQGSAAKGDDENANCPESQSLSACQALPQGDNGPLSQDPSLSVVL